MCRILFRQVLLVIFRKQTEAPAAPDSGADEEFTLVSQEFDSDHYCSAYPDVVAAGMNPVRHYLAAGWKEGRNPSAGFDTLHYLSRNRDVAESGINPFYHYLKHGRAEGRMPLPLALAAEDRPQVEAFFDADWYLKGFAPDRRPADPVEHYFQTGWREGRDPAPWFSTRVYLAQNADVRADGQNPFLHYIRSGRFERRVFGSGRVASEALYAAHAAATSCGPLFEDWAPAIAAGRAPGARVLAFYLPPRAPLAGMAALPRFEGHVQPRLPREPDLHHPDPVTAFRRQIDLARKAGVHGFCFPCDPVGGGHPPQSPAERMLADPGLDFPFALIWTNGGGPGLDGADPPVGGTAATDDAALVDGLARFMQDPRHLRIGGRPPVFLCRTDALPGGKARLDALRGLFRDRHGLEPLLMQARAIGSADPLPAGLDGAIELPPQATGAQPASRLAETRLLDPGFQGDIHSYAEAVETAARLPAPAFPLIRCAFPAWDTEPRHPGRGRIYAGSTPAAFEGWMRDTIAFARRHPVGGEAVVAVASWNGWDSGSQLEPDVHFGHAYLNALARAVHGVAALPAQGRSRVVIAGHDAHRHGAQQLALMIGQLLSRRFGVDVAFVLLGGGPMVADYDRIGPVHVLDGTPARLDEVLRRLRAEGYSGCITNTTVTGGLVPSLKAQGFAVVSLVHELGQLIRSYGLTERARLLAGGADRIIFPAEVVRDSFLAEAGPAAQAVEVVPQGLYRPELLEAPLPTAADRAAARLRLGLPETGRLVVTVGYGDLRKGIDRFAQVGAELCTADPEMRVAWVGATEAITTDWAFADVERLGLGDRIRRVGHVADIADWYAAADVMFLPSREDPFPSVVLEAMAGGLPVVGYAGTGGCDGLIAAHGALVDPVKPGAAAEAIRRLATLPQDLRQPEAASRRRAIATGHDFAGYCFGLLQRLNPALARVSVILPSYNYEAHLPMRLESIFDQTHPLAEIIVLDDASTDRSVEVIRQVAGARGRDIRLEIGAQNSGSPFAQWKKGLALATGDYVWIAEADDTADPRLVARLIRRMQAAGADLGFSDSWQIDAGDARTADSYVAAMTEFPPETFRQDFAMEGEDFLRRFLAVKNVILNVSSVVFRREALARALQAVGEELSDYAVAGDWRLYAEICAAGGRVVYDATALNGHRRHAASVTHALQIDRHLSEIGTVQRKIASRLDLDPATRARQHDHLEACRRHLMALATARPDKG